MKNLLSLALFLCFLSSGMNGQTKKNPVSASLDLTHGSAVRFWEENEVIPTYLAGAPDPNPMFFFGRGSQGAEGRIYPYPLYDNLTNKKSDKTYHLIYLENEYIKISVMPELGGRLFSALDKTNNYDFVYRSMS